MCLDVAPWSVLSVEACGTGAGFLYRNSEPELAHFRAHARLTSWKTRFGWLQPRLSLGFAELQQGDDEAGFSFTRVDSTGLATAGPEAGASLRAIVPMGSGFELVGDLSLNLAYLKYAPQLARPQSAWQPNAMLLVGVGF
jgi:hypothetical protein